MLILEINILTYFDLKSGLLITRTIKGICLSRLTGVSQAGLHRDSFLAPLTRGTRTPARCFRRVTQPPHIAGPLAVT